MHQQYFNGFNAALRKQVLTQICMHAQVEQIRETRAPQCRRVMETLDNLISTRLSFLEHPIFPHNLFQLSVITMYYVEYCLNSSSLFNSDLIHLWSVVDLLLNDSRTFETVDSFTRHVLLCLQTSQTFVDVGQI